MTDSERFQHLLNHRSDPTRADTYILNRVNFDFLLNSHNKYLKAKSDNERLKNDLKHYKGASL